MVAFRIISEYSDAGVGGNADVCTGRYVISPLVEWADRLLREEFAEHTAVSREPTGQSASALARVVALP